MSLPMPKCWEPSDKVYPHDPSIVSELNIFGRRGWKYLSKDLIMKSVVI
jgi:hypothetical protein